MTDQPDDWRLTNQMAYLADAVLEARDYQPTPGKDHDHCEFCWDEFGPRHEGEPGLTHGYTTTREHPHGDGYHWICERCFDDFRDVFRWRTPA